MTTGEMIVAAIKVLQSKGFQKPGNMQIQRAVWNMFQAYISLETISHYTDVG